MRAKDHRKPIPVGVKLKSSLLAAGFSEEAIEGGHIQFDHFPALGIRPVDEHGQIQPPANDYRYIRPMLKADHDIKTRGRGATTAGSDVGNAAKVKRLERDPRGGEEFRRRLLAKAEGKPPPETKKRKRPWPSRPFPNQRKDKR
jgi:hypothetical protein